LNIVNSHKSSNGVVTGLTARIVDIIALIDVVTRGSIGSENVTDLARAFVLPISGFRAELLAFGASWTWVECWAVLFVFALHAVLLTIADVLLTDAVVLSSLTL
jgi:hypothetical protein